MITALSLETPCKIWIWRGYEIAYQSYGDRGTPVLCIHGFGACWGHWRKNLPAIGQFYRCYAIDLIGFGRSSKPAPDLLPYTFETWAELVKDFSQEVIGESVALVGNSIGCVVALQVAVSYPQWVKSLCLLNCSLRLLHDRKLALMPWYRRLGAPLLQNLLKNKKIGHFFFGQIAKSQVVRKILLQAYKRHSSVTEELVEMLLIPARDQGAEDVFLAFTGYSQGPLPEDLLAEVSQPVMFLWGEDDPWESIELGRKFADFPSVQQFIPLQGVGHCPQDEAPEVVNPLIIDWLKGLL